jgi:hypothetical protein
MPIAVLFNVGASARGSRQLFKNVQYLKGASFFTSLVNRGSVSIRVIKEKIDVSF